MNFFEVSVIQRVLLCARPGALFNFQREWNIRTADRQMRALNSCISLCLNKAQQEIKGDNQPTDSPKSSQPSMSMAGTQLGRGKRPFQVFSGIPHGFQQPSQPESYWARLKS